MNQPRPSVIRALISRAQATRALIRITGDRDLAVQQREAADATNQSLRSSIRRRDVEIEDLRRLLADYDRRHGALLEGLSGVLEEREHSRITETAVHDRIRQLANKSLMVGEFHAAVDSHAPVDALEAIHERTQDGGR
jgi:hypothetical protein